MAILINILILLLCPIYWIYSGQIQVAYSFLCIYALGAICVKWIIREKISFGVYNLFFLIYGILLLWSQYLFIDGDPSGYFNHNDSVESFYKSATISVGPKKWEYLISGTILFSWYADYPLFALWINAWKLLGWDIGVTMDNLRLFLRLQDLLFSPMILAVMAKYMSEVGVARKTIKTACIIFGLFSYLYLTSCVYTRDLHVAFFYTLLGYYALSPKKHRFIYFKFLLIVLICFGLRPENGMFALIFPLYYRFRNIGFSFKLIIIGVVVLLIAGLSGILDSFLSLQEGYNERMAGITQGGIYSMFNSLPFPLPQIFNVIYSFIAPYPFILNVADTDHQGLIALPSIGIPFINVIMLLTLWRYVRTHHNYPVLWMFCIIILYITLTCIVEPNTRRTFAIIPTMYMLFIAVKGHILRRKYKLIVEYTIFGLIALNLPAILYLIAKGKLLS